MTVEPGAIGRPTADGAPDRVPATPAPVAGRRPTAAPTVTIVQRRATDIVCGEVIALPDDVFFPVPARVGGRRTWVWRSKPWRMLNNPHRWRLVCQADHLDDDAAIAASVPLGFRVLRVCDDHPDQGPQRQSLVIAVREHDLIDVQVCAIDTDRAQHDGHASRAGGARDTCPPGTALEFQEFRVRDAVVRVFDRSDGVGSDDASDMYVLEVLGISVLIRLRVTDPDSLPQLYLHVDNETRPPTALAVEVSNGGETHYRL